MRVVLDTNVFISGVFFGDLRIRFSKHSDEDEGYIADIPDLETCSAFSNTAEVALREVEVAKEAWIESARAEGKPVPPPAYRPLIYQFSQ